VTSGAFEAELRWNKPHPISVFFAGFFIFYSFAGRRGGSYRDTKVTPLLVCCVGFSFL